MAELDPRLLFLPGSGRMANATNGLFRWALATALVLIAVSAGSSKGATGSSDGSGAGWAEEPLNVWWTQRASVGRLPELVADDVGAAFGIVESTTPSNPSGSNKTINCT